MLTDQPSEVWTLRRNHREERCSVQRGKAGLQLRLETDGTLYFTHTFQDSEELMVWAQQQRAEMEAKGWQVNPSDRDGV